MTPVVAHGAGIATLFADDESLPFGESVVRVFVVIPPAADGLRLFGGDDHRQSRLSPDGRETNFGVAAHLNREEGAPGEVERTGRGIAIIIGDPAFIRGVLRQGTRFIAVFGSPLNGAPSVRRAVVSHEPLTRVAAAVDLNVRCQRYRVAGHELKRALVRGDNEGIIHPELDDAAGEVPVLVIDCAAVFVAGPEFFQFKDRIRHPFERRPVFAAEILVEVAVIPLVAEIFRIDRPGLHLQTDGLIGRDNELYGLLGIRGGLVRAADRNEDKRAALAARRFAGPAAGLVGVVGLLLRAGIRDGVGIRDVSLIPDGSGILTGLGIAAGLGRGLLAGLGGHRLAVVAGSRLAVGNDGLLDGVVIPSGHRLAEGILLGYGSRREQRYQHQNSQYQA